MKFNIATFGASAAILLTSEAFSTTKFPKYHSYQTLTRLQSADSDAVQDALNASREFGPASNQARVAWDIVEEIRARDNSAAFKAGASDALKNPTKNKEMYDRFLELQSLRENQRIQADNAKYVASNVRALKFPSPPKPSTRERLHNPILDHALSEAKAMTEKHGITSKEAKLAWEAVEHISSNDLTEAMKGSLNPDDDECLIEMIEACEAMEELNRALFLNANKETGRYQG